MNQAQLLLDQLILNFDQGLRTLCHNTAQSTRANPAQVIEEGQLSQKQRQHSAGLMRINHVGEVCAQALYQGQAMTARDVKIKDKMHEAAQEEIDHLAWCEQRLTELNSHTSYLNPLWYVGSLAIGTVAGIAGDRWNLGFVAETERQVVAHLTKHLGALPEHDHKSRAIVEQMRMDEAQHADMARAAGAAELPAPIKQIMSLMSRVMTTVAYYI